MTTTPSHHSVVYQNCLLNGEVIGMSRGFHGRKFTKRCGIKNSFLDNLVILNNTAELNCGFLFLSILIS